ncbi:MAG: cyclase family protein [Planctomycetota bacterium]|nr:MAG: cyclase family protein [Planctomycetota bacterium]
MKGFVAVSSEPAGRIGRTGRFGVVGLGSILGVGLTVFTVAVSASGDDLRRSGAEPLRMTQRQFDALVQEVSNWGRWGKDDELGALNLITPQKRLAAARLVREGVTVSLAHPVVKETAIDASSPFRHRMLKTGRSPGPWAMDEYCVSYHGYVHTHMDALCHLFYKDRMYNGFRREDVTPQGAGKLGIQNVRQGIFTRGLLVDIPRLRGVRFLEPGTAIYPEELTEWERTTGLKVRPGDVLLIRTGRWERRRLLGPWDPLKSGVAGLHASCGRWLRARDIAVLGTDGAADVLPSGVENVSHPIHVLMLHAMGVHIFDNLDLRELSRKCAERKRWEFLITVAPLVVEGGTGSPFNPIAVF